MTIPLHQPDFDQEEALINGCKNGDAKAQKALYNRFVEQLMMVCLRYANNKEDAEDILIQALVECFKSIGNMEYRGDGSLKAWLKRVTMNQCLMQLRKQRNDFCELDNELEERLPDSQHGSAIMQLSVKEIMFWIHELPTGYRTVFNLHVFEDMGHKDIATMLGISENTSKSQLHKARALLQKKIKGSQKMAL